MDESTEILSVGIDIGTSTTQVVFSRLFFGNASGYFSVPHISITGKEVVYKSSIYRTPLETKTLIHGEKVKEIVAGEFKKAGFTPKDTKTGAVIITGEAARKKNADRILKELSTFAGDFVVSTAGPDLEAVIAGKGSGAQEYSKSRRCRSLNLDIGGGTANGAVFDCGDTVSQGCLDIGGRQITFDKSGVIDYISKSADRIASYYGIPIHTGEQAEYEKLQRIAGCMAEILEDWALGKGHPILKEIKTSGSSEFKPGKIDAICFSGGVGDCVYKKDMENWDQYGDIGIILGQAIKESPIYRTRTIISPKETIRATVIGAGSYTTSVSGSTISYSRDIFPLKNIPVLRLDKEEEKRCFEGEWGWLAEKIRWLQKQTDRRLIAVAMEGIVSPSYVEVKTLAASLVQSMGESLGREDPFIVILERDTAKALGMFMARQSSQDLHDIVCIDSVKALQNDFIDMGKPLMDGMVIPVIVKTLILG